MTPEGIGVIAITVVIAIIGWLIRDKIGKMDKDIEANRLKLDKDGDEIRKIVQEHAIRLAADAAGDKADSKAFERIERKLDDQDKVIDRLVSEVAKIAGAMNGMVEIIRKQSGGFPRVTDPRKDPNQ